MYCQDCCSNIYQIFKAFLIEEPCLGLLNYIGSAVTRITWVHVLLGSNFLRGLPGLGGSKYSLRRSTCYVCHNFYMGFLDQKCFLRGLIFL